jgi:hypothetical protein
MNYKYKINFTVFLIAVLLPVTAANAVDLGKIKRPLKTAASFIQTVHAQEPNAQTEDVNCQFNFPEKKQYKAEFVAVRKKGIIAQGELFETKVYIKNAGNVPWFSSHSGCPYLITSLGTDNARDRKSVFFTEGLMWKSGWNAPNRINMDNKRVNPGETTTFTFWSKGPSTDGYYREYFTPVIEGVAWMDGGKFSTDVKVGNPAMDLEQKKYWSYIKESANLAQLDLNGEKTIEVSIANQKMKLKVGEYLINEFPVSTGKASTPTPLGTTKIFHKQEVRVAASRPHYIMPKWMSFRAGGYGIHALPSLANDNGIYWREALNHIGTRRSHGCIRLLPKDAEFAYAFADIGTTVKVVR